MAVEWEEIKSYYMREEVKREIIDYSKNRWVALEAPSQQGRLFLRYDKGNPLKIESESDYHQLFENFAHFKFRTIYATANVYSEINRFSISSPQYILRTTPTFDIDGSLEDFELIKKAADVIVDVLEKNKIVKSVYLKWSGRGIHVHINENSFSPEILKKYGPLNVAKSVVDFVMNEVRGTISSLSSQARGKERPLKVENKMDIQRVFTAPLSLHRALDLSCVVFKPDSLSSFDLSWANPKSFKHDSSWREYIVGEADELAEKAVLFKPEGPLATSPQEAAERKGSGVGRFQIMGLLQAARYYLLKGDLDKAKSFGLNRAIFYAWAKHYGPSKAPKQRKVTLEAYQKEEKIQKFEKVGNEEAPLDEKTGLFIIGDKVQTPSDYDREIAKKINSVVPYEEAWRKALEYLSKFPKEYLEDQRLFFERVYRPVRDTFLEKLLKEAEGRSSL